MLRVVLRSSSFCDAAGDGVVRVLVLQAANLVSATAFLVPCLTAHSAQTDAGLDSPETGDDEVRDTSELIRLHGRLPLRI